MTNREQIQKLRGALAGLLSLFSPEEMAEHDRAAAEGEHDRENCALCQAQKAIRETEER